MDTQASKDGPAVGDHRHRFTTAHQPAVRHGHLARRFGELVEEQATSL